MRRKLKSFVKLILGRSNLQYHLDVINTDTISGWAFNTVSPETPCKIELKSDTKVIATTKAATLREDLKQAGIGNGCHAFNIQLELLPLSATPREVHLYIDNKRVTTAPIVLKSSFNDMFSEFTLEVEKRIDAMFSIQAERLQREYDYLQNQLKKD